MDSLEYSKEANEAKHIFYNKELTVFVEGKEDILFWSYLFDMSDLNVLIEDVGGKIEIDKLIEDVIVSNAEFYIACDKDHSEFFEEKKEHEKIIRTFGYSIENSMYNLKEIEKIITKLCKQKVDLMEELKIWRDEFSESAYELLVLDIANHKYGKGVSVFGDNCQPLLLSQKSHRICSEKKTRFINTIKDSFKNNEIELVKKLIEDSKKDTWFLLKGHFTTNAIINVIKYYMKKLTGSSIGISKDILYSFTIDCRENWDERIDIKPIVETIRKIPIA